MSLKTGPSKMLSRRRGTDFYAFLTLALSLVTVGANEAHFQHKTTHGGYISTLREHSSGSLCNDWPPNILDSHKVEKRSYLPPVTCSSPHETSAIKSKVYCKPRPKVVRLPWPNDTNVHQMTPSHVEVQRCDGGCFHQSQSCLPLNIKKKVVPVLLAQCSIRSEKCDKICAEIEIEEHTECNCDCKVKEHHCNNKQIYREDLCSCQCQDISEVQACHDSGRVWDPGMCLCRCPLSSLQHCSTNYVFDFTNSCRCIPEETNEIPGNRAERSHEPQAFNWELVAYGGLGGVFLLATTLFFVVNHMCRLKRKLRQSEEALVPKGASAPLMPHRMTIARETGI